MNQDIDKGKIILVAIAVVIVCSGIALGFMVGSGKLYQSKDDADFDPMMDGVDTDAVGVYQKISAEEIKEMIDERPFIPILDVRTKEERMVEWIDGSAHIPDFEIADRVESEFKYKDQIIFVHCQSGRRSAMVAKKMVDMGYTSVYDIGGIIDWPYETVK